MKPIVQVTTHYPSILKTFLQEPFKSKPQCTVCNDDGDIAINYIYGTVIKIKQNNLLHPLNIPILQ